MWFHSLSSFLSGQHSTLNYDERILVQKKLKFVMIWRHGAIKGMHQLRRSYSPKMLDRKFDIFFNINFMWLKVYAVVVPTQGWWLVQFILVSGIRLIKVPQAYSQVESSQLSWLNEFTHLSVLCRQSCVLCLIMPLLQWYVTIFRAFYFHRDFDLTQNEGGFILALVLMDLDMYLLEGKPTVSDDNS